VRLAAIREAFDRLLGKAPIAVDTTVAKVDMGAAYLRALKAVNAARDVTPTSLTDAPALAPSAQDEAHSATDRADDAW
jgi:hypothetical protein